VVSAREDGSGLLLPDHIEGLERQLPPKRESSRTLAEAERDCIRASLERNGWARGVSAKELGIARSTLAEKMRRYSLKDISP
jgi:DNA-binding NtrC family response regulator